MYAYSQYSEKSPQDRHHKYFLPFFLPFVILIEPQDKSEQDNKMTAQRLVTVKSLQNDRAYDIECAADNAEYAILIETVYQQGGTGSVHHK